MWQEEEDVVDRRWAIDWDAALAPPLSMIPDLSVLVSPIFDDIPVGADLSRPPDCAMPPEWENALSVGLGNVEEEEAAAFQRDSLHL